MRLVVLALAVLAGATPALAQSTSDPLPRVAFDIHGVTVGLPTAEGWVPPVSADTPLPGRAWGVAGGGHVYVARLGFATLGVGASVTMGKATSDPLTDATTGAPTTASVTTQATHLSPQLSFNFGHKLGWSYLSAGYGVSKVTSTSTAFGTTPAMAAPEGWNPAINFGGGARWFMKPHLGAGFDVRFTKLSSRETTATQAGAKRTQVFSIGVGITIQ
jgi:Outer membrane protein beta-barrel domain